MADEPYSDAKVKGLQERYAETSDGLYIAWQDERAAREKAEAELAAMRSGAPPNDDGEALPAARGFTDGDAIRYVDRAIQALESGGAGTDWALRELRLLWGRLARERHLAEGPGLAAGEGERDGSVRITAVQRAGLARAQGLAEAIRDMPDDSRFGAAAEVAEEIVDLLEPLRVSLLAPHLDLTREEAEALVRLLRGPLHKESLPVVRDEVSALFKLRAFLAEAPPEEDKR